MKSALTQSAIACVLCIIVPVALIGGDTGYKVTYDGGSIPAIKAGTGLRLYIDTNQIRFVNDKEELIAIPASSVTEISYGQDVHRRVGTAVAVGVFTLGLGALTALSRSQTISWTNV
jgi:hypothetical protein